jgi:translation initiation factor IF-3
MLRGRENQYSEIAADKMKTFIESLEELYKLDGQIKKSGNTFNAMLKVKK